MPLRTLLFFVVLGALGVFAFLNWNAFNQPTALSFGFTTFEAPLGLIMLGVVSLLTVLFLFFIVYLQTSLVMSMRRQARDLEHQRVLADQAEASRFTELRKYLESEMEKLAAQRAEIEATMVNRVDQLEGGTKKTLEQMGNSLAAYIGELEDRLQRPRLERGVESPPPLP